MISPKVRKQSYPLGSLAWTEESKPVDLSAFERFIYMCDVGAGDTGSVQFDYSYDSVTWYWRDSIISIPAGASLVRSFNPAPSYLRIRNPDLTVLSNIWIVGTREIA